MGKVDEEQMQLAIQAYRSENISFENAAKRYGVKITTLKDRVNGGSNKVGRPTRLSGFTEAHHHLLNHHRLFRQVSLLNFNVTYVKIY